MGAQYADLSLATSQDVHLELTRELYVAYMPISIIMSQQSLP